STSPRCSPGSPTPRPRPRPPAAPATSTAPRPGDPALTFLSPDYGGRSLGDVLPAVAHARGAGHSFARPGLVLPPAQKYVVFLVDGLGHDLLRDHAEAAPYLHSLLTEGG